MRKPVSVVLVFLGGFLLALGALAAFYAPDKVKRTPLDVHSVTRLSGEASLAAGTSMEKTPVKASSTNLSDTSKSDDDVIVFNNASCLVKDPDGSAPDCVSADDTQNRLITVSTSTFATDRRTGLAVMDAKYVPAGSEPMTGLVNKFPFDVEQKTYPFWDGTAKKAVDAVYAGEATVQGLPTYKFTTSVTDAPIEITAGTPGTYTDEKTMFVDPGTGSIIDQTEHQVRKMADSGNTVLDLQFAFTPATVKANVDAANENNSKLSLLTKTVPLIGFIGGAAALLAGLLLYRRQGEAVATSTRSRSTQRRSDEGLDALGLGGDEDRRARDKATT